LLSPLIAVFNLVEAWKRRVQHVQRKGGAGVQGFCGGLIGVSRVHHVPGLRKGSVGVSVQGRCQGFVVLSLCLQGTLNSQLCLYSMISYALCILYHWQVLVGGVFERDCLLLFGREGL
jgi:hypothetical protein